MQGHDVVRIFRKSNGEFELCSLEGADVIIHLAGESITGRWSRAKKERIFQSRVAGTQSLIRAFSKLRKPPGAFLCASAVGFYGDRGTAELTEEASSGSGFLPDVCRQWEDAASVDFAKETRVISLRFGVVLSPKGGVLKNMLVPARFGLAGPFGSGSQFMSWIAIEDVAGLIEHAIRNESIRGPLNVVAPNPLTNREFMRTLCKVLRRPMAPALPAWLLRGILGELADALLLSSIRAIPQKALASGYRFRYPILEGALRAGLQPAHHQS
jgi:uncharacterized protein (TIGR01777 family)